MAQATNVPSGFSADTEILTRRGGWLTFDRLTYADEVATRSPDGRFEWRFPRRIIREHYDGEMVEFLNNSVDLLLAPVHPLLVRRVLTREQRLAGHQNQWHTRTAGDFLARRRGFQFEVPFTSTWESGTSPAEFTLPGRPASYPNPGKDRAAEWLVGYLTQPWTISAEVTAAARARGIGLTQLTAVRNQLGIPARRVGWGRSSYWELGLPTRTYKVTPATRITAARGLRLPVKTFCAFLGLYLAEGWVRRDRDWVIIAQAATSRHLPEIKGILDATGLTWNWDPRNRKFTTCHLVLAEWLRENCGYRAWNKRFPQGFLDFTPDILEAMLRGMMIGDGFWAPRGQRRYPSTSEHLVNGAQEIFQKLGADTWINWDATPPAKPHHHSCHVVHERVAPVHQLPPPGTCMYHGIIVRLAIPNSVVYVRHDGRATWAGSGEGEIPVAP